MLSKTIKVQFGKLLRDARDKKRISRAALGVRLGISPKTIQSWEMGRTFIEDLSLIPALESELDISISDFIAHSVQGEHGAATVKEPSARYGKGVTAGPTGLHVAVQPVLGPEALDPDRLETDFVAVPSVKTNSLRKPVSELTAKDFTQHVIIPRAWVPRGGVLIACRMGDSGMNPMIPLGGTVIVDRRGMALEKAMNRVVALDIHNRGVRIRRLVTDAITRKVIAMTAVEGRRGRVDFRADQGDTILGPVVGILAQPQ